MHDPLPIDRSFSYPVQCGLLKIVGAWPLKQTMPTNFFDALYLFWSYLMIVIVAATQFCQHYYFFSAWGDILAVADCGCAAFMGMHVLFRLIHLTIKRNSLRQLITKFVKHIWISK